MTARRRKGKKPTKVAHKKRTKSSLSLVPLPVLYCTAVGARADPRTVPALPLPCAVPPAPARAAFLFLREATARIYAFVPSV